MRWITNSEIITVKTEENNGTPFHPKILSWDITRCMVSKVIYEEETFDNISDPDISIIGNIVFTRNIKGEHWVTVYTPFDGSVSMIEMGFGATWSPDGTQIAFTGAEGLYISDGEGKTIRKAVDLTVYYPVEDGKIVWDEWPPMAVWSPDGRFLLYHRRNGGTYEIAKSEIATQTETVLYQGGMYPDWR
jgi:hypothetical protein